MHYVYGMSTKDDDNRRMSARGGSTHRVPKIIGLVALVAATVTLVSYALF